MPGQSRRPGALGQAGPAYSAHNARSCMREQRTDRVSRNWTFYAAHGAPVRPVGRDRVGVRRADPRWTPVGRQSITLSQSGEDDVVDVRVRKAVRAAVVLEGGDDPTLRFDR